jgi:hypothetical protein
MNLNEELFKALIDGDLTKVKELLKRGAYVNTRNEKHQLLCRYRGTIN